MADPGGAAGAGGDSHPGRAAVASAYRRFEPRAYLRNNHAPPRGDLSGAGVGPWKLRCLADTFATGERGTRAGAAGSGGTRAGAAGAQEGEERRRDPSQGRGGALSIER